MAIEQVPADMRFHITVFDDSGAVIEYPDQTMAEVREFETMHLDDDLNYAIERGVRHA